MANCVLHSGFCFLQISGTILYRTSFISWIHVWWKVWVYQYKNSENYSDIFFLNLACFIPDVVHCWLEIYTYGIKILLNQIEAQIWHDITWVDQKVLFFFKTCQFLYLVKTFSAGFLLSEKLLDCNRFSSFFSLWFTLHLKIPKCASHSG